MDRGAWQAHGVIESDTSERLTHNLMVLRCGAVER